MQTALDLPAIYRQLADRVRGARARLGLSQQQLADRVGMSRSEISEIESGTREVWALEVAKLSWALGESLEQLVGASEQSDGGEAPRTAAAPAGPATAVGPRRRARLDRWLRLCEEFHALETELGAEHREDLRPPRRVMSSFEEAEALADEERARLELGPAPAHVLLGVLEERVGIKVFHVDLDDEISGGSVMSPRFGPAVLVNRRHTPGGRAFTLAHQWFHLLVRGLVLRTNGAASWRVCDGISHGEEKDRVEQMADRFAAHLLVPPNHLRQRLRLVVRPGRAAEPLELMDLARYFGVSMEAVLVQFAQRELAPWTVAIEGYRGSAFQQSMAQAGSEWGPEPQRFRRLVVRAHLEERISRARMAELLGITLSDVDDVLRWSGDGRPDRGVSASLPR